MPETLEDWLMFVVMGVMGLFALFLVLAIPYSMAQSWVGNRDNVKCLKAGYPQTEVTWNFEVYCKKRVDQTDVVLPLAEAIR